MGGIRRRIVPSLEFFVPESDMPPQVSITEDRPVLRRVAWILVIIMTALLALALIGVVWGFIRQGRILMEGRAARQAPPVPGGIALPPGAKIISSSTDAGRLVLRLQTPAGEEIRIIDLASGKPVQTIKTRP
jgi:hypothetical protein